MFDRGGRSERLGTAVALAGTGDHDSHVLRPGHRYGDGSEFGLDPVLDGLERHRA